MSYNFSLSDSILAAFPSELWVWQVDIKSRKGNSRTGAAYVTPASFKIFKNRQKKWLKGDLFKNIYAKKKEREKIGFLKNSQEIFWHFQ